MNIIYKDRGKMKYILFGTGNYYQRYKAWFLKEESVVLIDNSKEKQNTTMDGFPILAPEEAIKRPYDIIVILSFFVSEMKSQLLALGVEEKKIFHFYDIYALFGANKIENGIIEYKTQHTINNTKKILLLSNDCELMGPGIALYRVALFLHNYRFNVTFGTMIDGPLRKKLLQYNIDVIVDCNLQASTMDDIEWTKQYDLIFCNTLNYHIFLMKHQLDVPIIWWLHDPSFFYEGARKENFDKIDTRNIYMYTVGDIAKNALKQYMPNAQTKELLYGVEEKESNQLKNYRKSTIRFLIIGYINMIKGQDILCKAIELLTDDEKQKTEFVFVGNKSSVMAKEMEKKYGKAKNTSFIGPVDREKVNELLNEADILICPSRLDAMPTVCVEAMMHKIPCLVSDVTGMVKYIKPFFNGLIFESENVEDLRDKIKWCIVNKHRIREMGCNARKIFDNYFSDETFKRNIISIIEKVLLLYR